MSETELPQWKCHKVVRASKIVAITNAGNGACDLGLEHLSVLRVSKEFMDKHKPERGGYFVRYADGYESYSPAQAFEEGYTLIEEHRPHTGKGRLGKVAKGSLISMLFLLGCSHADLAGLAQQAAPIILQHAKQLGEQIDPERSICFPVPTSELPDEFADKGVLVICYAPALELGDLEDELEESSRATPALEEHEDLRQETRTLRGYADRLHRSPALHREGPARAERDGHPAPDVRPLQGSTGRLLGALHEDKDAPSREWKDGGGTGQRWEGDAHTHGAGDGSGNGRPHDHHVYEARRVRVMLARGGGRGRASATGSVGWRGIREGARTELGG